MQQDQLQTCLNSVGGSLFCEASSIRDEGSASEEPSDRVPSTPAVPAGDPSAVDVRRSDSLGRVRARYELPVDCWTLDGGLLLRSFSSLRAAAEALDIPHPRLLADCLFEEPPVAYGFQWRLNSAKPREEKGAQLSIEVTYSILMSF